MAHSGTIRAALAIALGLFAGSALTFKLNNLSITEIENLVEGDSIGWCVNSVNR